MQVAIHHRVECWGATILPSNPVEREMGEVCLSKNHLLHRRANGSIHPRDVWRDVHSMAFHCPCRRICQSALDSACRQDPDGSQCPDALYQPHRDDLYFLSAFRFLAVHWVWANYPAMDGCREDESTHQADWQNLVGRRLGLTRR